MPRRRLACLLAATAALSACQDEAEPISPACTSDAATLARALETAPGPVRLPDGTPISGCVAEASSDAELQSFGTVAVGLAEELASRAQSDGDAALQLGYLIGAARSGGATTQGVTVELVHRLEVAARRVPRAQAGQLDRGERAGERSG
jgi:hypothetical protein